VAEVARDQAVSGLTASWGHKNIALLHCKTPDIFWSEQYLFRPVLARDKREALLRLADRLCLDLGFEGQEDPAGEPEPGSEDEILVASLRGALARLAALVAGPAGAEGSSRAVETALDGAEMVMRGELLKGEAAELQSLLPGFVFLVTQPVAGQDRALELSKRTERLVD
jgi:hypothetical protein